MGKAKGNTYKRAHTFPPPDFADLLLQGLLQILIREHIPLQPLPQGKDAVQLSLQVAEAW